MFSVVVNLCVLVGDEYKYLLFSILYSRLTMILEDNIDLSLLDETKPVLLAYGGSEYVGYNLSNFYSLKLYYIPSEDKVVLSKKTVNQLDTWVFDSLESAVHKYNMLYEDTYEMKEVVDRFDVPSYIIDAL